MLIRTQDAINKQILNSTVHIPEEGTGAEGQDKFPLRNQYCILWPSKNSGCQNEWLAKKPTLGELNTLILLLNISIVLLNK